MKVPNADTLRRSAASHLRNQGNVADAEILGRSQLEISQTAQRYSNTTVIGLYVTLRCHSSDLAVFREEGFFGEDVNSDVHARVKAALGAVLPVEFQIHEMSARAFLVEKDAHELTELEALIDAQQQLMIAVATGGPRIESRNDEYKARRAQIRTLLAGRSVRDPNQFDDLWAWYGRWKNGDLPTYQSRRDYVRGIYQSLRDSLHGDAALSTEPNSEPTGWTRVDRVVDQLIAKLPAAEKEEEFQTIGLLCREALISLAQAVYKPGVHKTSDGVEPSSTDANRMLDAYLSTEYAGQSNEALRRHAKAALVLANDLQHRRTATHRDASLCAEATRTVINIVAITSGRR